jgi:hypothetical protein
MVTTQNVPSASDASVTPGQPSKSPDASTKPEPTKDASTPPDAASTPPPQVPTTPPTDGGMAVDAEIPAGRPAQRAQLTLLLQTAGLSRDDRALIGLVTLMVGSAMSGEDLLDVLAPLEKAGNCTTFGQVNCATVCAIVASRCSLCTAESGCLAAGQRVCGFEGMNCR